MAKSPMLKVLPPSDEEQTSETLAIVTKRLTCPACHMCYDDPRVLPCLHVFCHRCLERLEKHKGESTFLRCPTCTRVHYLPPNRSNGFVPAFHLHHLYDVQDVLKKSVAHGGNLVQKCEKCSSDKATAFCKNCGLCICQQCVTIHEQWSELAGHEVISIHQVQEEAAKMVSIRKKALLCSKHINKELEMYCETCSELVCRCCYAQLHSNHHCDFISVGYLRNKQVIETKVFPLKGHLEAVNQSLINIEAIAHAVVGQKEAIEEEVLKTIATLQEHLETLKTEYLKTLHSITDTKLDRLTAQKDKLESFQIQLMDTLHFAEERLTAGSEGEVLAVKRYIISQTESIIRDLEPKILAPCERPNVTFNSQSLRQILLPGRSSIYTASLCPLKCFASGDNVHVTTVFETTNVTINVKDEFDEDYLESVDSIIAELIFENEALICEVTRITCCQYRVTYVTDTPGIQRLHVLINGQHIKGSPIPVRIKPPETHGLIPKKILKHLKSASDSMAASTGTGIVLFFNRDVSGERAEIY